MYDNQLALEAALMEITLWVEQRGCADVGENVRGALQAIGENAGYIKPGVGQVEGRPEAISPSPPRDRHVRFFCFPGKDEANAPSARASDLPSLKP